MDEQQSGQTVRGGNELSGMADRSGDGQARLFNRSSTANNCQGCKASSTTNSWCWKPVRSFASRPELPSDCRRDQAALSSAWSGTAHLADISTACGALGHAVDKERKKRDGESQEAKELK
jgi:hypothetical protein